MRPYQYLAIVFNALAFIICIAYFYGSVSLWWIAIVYAIFLLISFMGVVNIRWNYFFKSLSRGNNSNLIALTFDDGPAKETEAILDILKEHKVPATFFIIGKNAEAKESIVKRMDGEGHLVGNHSYHHGFNFDWQNSRKMADDIILANKKIESIISKKPLLFRPPYGITNPNLARAVKRSQVYSIGWSLRSFDTKTTDPTQLLQRIKTKLKGGDIVLLHDSMPVTTQILTELIIYAREKGYTFAPVDSLLNIKAYAS